MAWFLVFCHFITLTLNLFIINAETSIFVIFLFVCIHVNLNNKRNNWWVDHCIWMWKWIAIQSTSTISVSIGDCISWIWCLKNKIIVFNHIFRCYRIFRLVVRELAIDFEKETVTSLHIFQSMRTQIWTRKFYKGNDIRTEGA